MSIEQPLVSFGYSENWDAACPKDGNKHNWVFIKVEHGDNKYRCSKCEDTTYYVFDCMH